MSNQGLLLKKASYQHDEMTGELLSSHGHPIQGCTIDCIIEGGLENSHGLKQNPRLKRPSLLGLDVYIIYLFRAIRDF
jgi:hypothetical protein